MEPPSFSAPERARVVGGSSSGLGGLAATAPAHEKHYQPGEFSLALGEIGIPRSSRWVRDEVRSDRITRNPAFRSRIEIPESELFRLAGIQEVRMSAQYPTYAELSAPHYPAAPGGAIDKLLAKAIATDLREDGEYDMRRSYVGNRIARKIAAAALLSR